MMANRQGRGTIGVLLAVAVATVVALFGVWRWDQKDARPALSGDPTAPAQTADPQRPAEQREASAQPVPAASGAPETAAGDNGSTGQAAASKQATPDKQAAPGKQAALGKIVGEPEAKPSVGEPTAPSFDIVRIEPNGESVIAGRGVPGDTIELLRDGQVHARAAADASGLFAIVPPALPPGSHQVTLQSISPDGTRQRSRDSVTVVISEGRNTRPLVALTSPDRPTVVLSNPEPPESKAPETKTAEAPLPPSRPAQQQQAGAAAASPASSTSSTARQDVKILTVEAEEGGRLYVSGQAAPGATVRLYLNESFIAPGGVGGDGHVSFAIGRGVRPGDYRVRLDDVDPVSGSVKSRAEVAFKVPVPIVVPAPPAVVPTVTNPVPALSAGIGSGSTSPATDPQKGPAKESSATRPSSGSRVASALPEGRDLSPSAVLIPDINTTIISRGDNLWRLSQRIYGQGLRYTVIYGANKNQIRNPNLIYPGQLFVLPTEAAAKPN
jgi:nucleoid-associated protein YgaU